MSTRWARFARGWLAATFATLVAAVSHGLAGGGAPSGVSIALALAFSGIVSIALAGRTLSLPRLAASVVASQLAFHTLFATVGSSTVWTQTGHHGMVMGTGSSGHAHSDGWMWVGHTVAAVITVAALRFGERAFWGLRETARLGLARFARVAAVVVERPRVVASFRVEPGMRSLMLLRVALRYRGPPVSSLS